MSRRAGVPAAALGAIATFAALAASGALAQDAPPPQGPAAAARADGAVVIDEATLRASGWLREDWYSVTARDVKVGWLRRSLAIVDEGGAPHVVREFEVFLDVAGDGSGSTSRWRTSFPLAAPQRVARASMSSDEAGRHSSREAVRNGDRFDVVTESRGRKLTGAVVAPEVTLADELAFERLAVAAAARAEGPAGTTLTVQGFALATLGTSPRRLGVKALHGGDAGAAREFDVEVVAGGASRDVANSPANEIVKEIVRVDAAGNVLSGALGQVFRYVRTDRERATGAADRKSIEAMSRIPLEGKLGDVPSIVRLTISCPADLAAVFPAHPRQLARQQGDRTTVIIVPNGPRAEVTDADREAALAPEPGLEIDTREVREIAERLSVGANSRAGQADVLCRFVAEALTDEVVLGPLTTREILAKKRGDCTEHTQVFIALCRAIGLPARPVTGLVWMGDETGAFGWHTWAEVALEGRWSPADPTMGTMGADAAHIVVDDSPQGRARLWGAQFKLEKAERLPPKPADPK